MPPHDIREIAREAGTAAAKEVAASLAREAAKEAIKNHSLKKDQVEKIVQETISEIFIRLGIPSGDPIEVQKDMQHLRQWRKGMESVQSKGILTMVGIAISGTIAAIWLGFKEMIK